MDMRFEFEKVSVDDARRALDVRTFPPGRPTWVRARMLLPVAPVALDDAALGWLAGMPEALAPRELARRFPCIANELSALWKRPSRCELYLRDLMLDGRAGRERFPVEVMRELSALSGFYAELYPARPADWGKVGKR